MCVYIVQYYAINLMFNSVGVAAFPCQEAKGAPGTSTASPLVLSQQREVLHRRAWIRDQPSVIP